MERSWINRRDSLALVMLASISFVIENTLGIILFLLPFTSLPLIGGWLSGWVDAILIFIAIYIIPRRGAGMLFATVLLALSTVTVSFGPPGWHKLLIGIGLGLIIDIVRELLGRKRVSANITAVSVAFALSVPFTYLAWKWFGPPGFETVLPTLTWIPFTYLLIGWVGAYAGWRLFKKNIAHYEIVRSFQSGER